MTDTIVRRLSEIDIVSIINMVKNEYFNCCGFEDYWTKDELENWIRNDNDICLGYYDDGKLKGFCLTHYNRMINKIYLENIYVCLEYRRKGVAYTLINEMFKYYSNCNDESLNRFVAIVECGNEASMELLVKAGFSVGDKMYWMQKNQIEK